MYKNDPEIEFRYLSKLMANSKRYIHRLSEIISEDYEIPKYKQIIKKINVELTEDELFDYIE